MGGPQGHARQDGINATYFAKSDHRHHLVGRTPSSAAGPLAGSSMIAGA